jgi:hypothetical protein
MFVELEPFSLSLRQERYFENSTPNGAGYILPDACYKHIAPSGANSKSIRWNASITAFMRLALIHRHTTLRSVDFGTS